MHALRMTLLFFGVATFPLYIFPSGLPQPSHLILFGFALTFFWKGTIFRHPSGMGWLIIAFWLYVTYRQMFFSAAQGGSHMDPAIYLFLNSLIAVAVYISQQESGRRFYQICFLGTIASLLVASTFLVFSGSSLVLTDQGMSRSIGSFNNPNQLGYFSVCSAGIISAIWYVEKRYTSIYIFGMALAFYSAATSLSKAAMLGIVFYLFIMITGLKWWQKACVIAVVSASMLGLSEIDVEDIKFIRRLGSIGQDSDDSFEARGYGIVMDPDLRLLYGWGEGYANSLIGHEVHSTFGNIVVSYGFAGSALALIAVTRLVSRSLNSKGLVYTASMTLPVMVYGIAHNGIRFSIFWVFLSVFFGLVSIVPKAPKGRTAR